MATTATPAELEAQTGGPGGPGNGHEPGWDGGGGSSRRLPPGTQMLGMWIGLAAITMLFTGMTSAYIVREGLGVNWFPIEMPVTLLFTTAVLLLSSLTMELARRHYRKGRVAAAPASRWLMVTLALGSLFLIGQFVAWRQLAAEGLFLSTNPHSSFFYILTAMHGAHVLGGLAALGWLAFMIRSRSAAPAVRGRAWKRSYTVNRKSWIDVTALYWHFMDGLWIYLLVLLFVVR